MVFNLYRISYTFYFLSFWYVMHNIFVENMYWSTFLEDCSYCYSQQDISTNESLITYSRIEHQKYRIFKTVTPNDPQTKSGICKIQLSF